MFREFSVALVSFLFNPDYRENIKSIKKNVKKATRSGCNLVCFPECAINGLPTENYEKDVQKAITIPGKVTEKLCRIADDNSIFMAIGLLEISKGKLYDSAMMIDDKGKITLKYRRINPQWHSKNVPKQHYREGCEVKKCSTPYGEFAFAICGDIADKKVITEIKRVNSDYLIVPMLRSFEDYKYDSKRWDNEEKLWYARQIKNIGITSFIINTLQEEENGGSFGGTMIVSGEGNIIAESEIEKPSFLIYKFTKPS